MVSRTALNTSSDTDTKYRVDLEASKSIPLDNYNDKNIGVFRSLPTENSSETASLTVNEFPLYSISAAGRIHSHIRTVFAHLIRQINEYSKVFRHPLVTLVMTRLRNSPWILSLKDGSSVKIEDRDQLFRYIFKYLHQESFVNEFISRKSPNGQNIMIKPLRNGDIFRAFVNGDYEWLPVKDKTVVDIGASVGDTAVFFAGNGAKQIYALEPFPKSYEKALENISLNGFDNLISLKNEGIGCAGTVYINPDFVNNNSSTLNYGNEHGVPIPVKTLKNILEENAIDEAVLKMDCEGSEYDAILREDNSTLRRFSHIQMEYHFGYDSLQRKLKDAGFEVKITKPMYIKSRDPSSSRKSLYYGYLYATRKN